MVVINFQHVHPLWYSKKYSVLVSGEYREFNYQHAVSVTRYWFLEASGKW